MSAFLPPVAAHHRAFGTAALVALAIFAAATASSAPVPVYSGSAAIQTPQALQLSAAPVRLVAPADRGQWALRLAGYANDAARALEEIIGLKVPAGELRWAPDPMVALETSASVRLEQTPNGPVIQFNDPFAILAEDQGVAFATGYAAWLMAYALGRLYFADAEDPEAWWTDGAALYLTDVVARRARATTPILYNLDSAYSTAIRQRQPVPLEGAAAAAAGNAARGKAYLTFRMLEALYGEAAVNNLLLLGANAPAARNIQETAVGNLPADLMPRPEAVFDAWLKPTAGMDLGLARVRVTDAGTRISGEVTRASEIPAWTQVEVRLATGERVYADIPASTQTEPWEIEISAAPVDVRLDPEGRLPDINRSNNRFGFGSADRIRSFFPLDEQIEIGALHFSGEIKQVGRKRVEEFTVTFTNLTEEPVGLGMLVSAQWIDRPATRTQRRVFVVLPPGESRMARDFVEFPRRGRGGARIEARYWRADDPAALTERLLRDPADQLNSYLIIRAPEAATGPDGSPLERLAANETIEPVAELTIPGGGVRPEAALDDNGPSADRGDPVAVSADEEDFAVRIISPAVNAIPLGEMSFSVAVDGPPALMTELYVNDQIVGRGSGSNAQATFTAEEDEHIFALRVVAVGTGGRIATDSRMLLRGDVLGFGASVDLVTLNVTVRQPGGGFIEDLTADDFQVVEDGVVQELVSFAKGEDTAISAAMLIDTSSSMIGGGIANAKAGANKLVDTLLRGNDRAMVLGFNDRLYLYSDFTNEVEALRIAIGSMHSDGATSLFDAVVEALRKVNRRTGRRALIVLSDGLDVHSRFDFPDVLEYTRQSDVLVYTVGLQLMHDATELGDASAVVRESVENLRALAEITGGSAYFPLQLDELENVYAEIAAELESQYSVSYYPTNQEWDGEWRQLDVTLKDRVGRIQARPGYYGVRPGDRR